MWTWVLPARNPSGAIYGVIVVGALLAGESGRHETYGETVGSAAIATVLYWLAHAYAGLLGRRLAHGERLSAGALWRALVHDWSLVRGAGLPLIVLVIAWATGASQTTAVTAALWSAAIGLLALELLAGLRARAAPGELALDAAVGLAMGLAVLGMKVLLH